MKRNLLMAAAILSMSTVTYDQQAMTHMQYSQLRTVINPAASLMNQGGEVSVIGRR